MPLQKISCILQCSFEATHFCLVPLCWQSSNPWASQSAMGQAVTMGYDGYDCWGPHIQEERRRGVEMLLSGYVFNGWKWLYEIVMVCCTPFALVSWRRRRRKREREREIRNYWSTWIPWILLEPGAMFMTIHFSLSFRITFGSSKDRRLQVDGSTSASNRFMHEDDTVFMWHFRFDVSLLIMDNWWF